jgi:hypothetical protein
VNTAPERQPTLEEQPVDAAETARKWHEKALSTIRGHMSASRIKGNPKDYVLLVDHKYIVDYKRALEIKATLPAPLLPGMYVWVMNVHGQMVAVEVREDRGETLLTFNEKSETVVDRKEVFATPIPKTPTVVHKSKIAPLLGDRIQDMFWIKGVGMRRS